MTVAPPSPFFARGDNVQDGSLAILSLNRDQQMAVLIRSRTNDGRDPITNTRFGSYPHSTLIDRPWGSQIIATNVNASDPSKRGKKRKRPDGTEGEEDGVDAGAGASGYEPAARGFAHIIPPTPEMWTVSLPHRTQVVYTPDYSFILQRLRARPGETLIEAGAGSGSFTHAAARAVFSGSSERSVEISEARDAGADGDANAANSRQASRKRKRRCGKVCSFEYHEPRATQLRQEIAEHGLEEVVTVTHRDVYENGFLLDDGTSPQADIIFLDLPEPRRALEQLVRKPAGDRTSPLNPNSPARICTFSPCIEQVQQTVEALQRLGWVEISTFELQHKRLDVRRDQVSLNYEGLRGVNASAANVEEALNKLRELDVKIANYHVQPKKAKTSGAVPNPKNDIASAQSKDESKKGDKTARIETKQQRLERIQSENETRKVWREGRLVHRTEPELKTHTSYLTFAVLPRAWTAEDDDKLIAKSKSGDRDKQSAYAVEQKQKH